MTPGRVPVSLLRAGLWLAVVLVGAKWVLAELTLSLGSVGRLAMVSWQDVLFAVVLGTGGEMLVRAARPRPRISALLRGVSVLLMCGCALFSVVGVGVFDYFGRPLSYDLLRLVRHAAAVESSVTERITPVMGVALVAVPVVFFCGVWFFCRRRGVPVRGLGVVAAWVVVGVWQWSVHVGDMHDLRLASNPHFELVRSTLERLSGVGRPEFSADFPAADVEDFRSYGARGGGVRGGFELPVGVERPRNVIVIVLESVGTKYMSLYGSGYETTPKLVEESAHSMVFDAISAQGSYTYYSFRSLNFSIYPGLPWCFAPWGGRPLPETLASVMKRRGARTIYLHNGDLDWEDSRWLLEGKGFDALLGYEELGGEKLTSWGKEDRYLFDRLIGWIDEGDGEPFHAVCWTDQTHDPYAPGPGVPVVDFFGDDVPDHEGEDLGRYLNVLHETDRQLGRLFAALRERGLADETLVVVTGDHGEAFRDPHAQRGHGLTVYQEEVSVPLMLWNPRLFAGGVRGGMVGGHVDVNPTIADVLGVEVPGGWQGYSLFEAGRPDRAYFLTDVDEYLFGVREGRWKYVFEATGGREMLFDLEADAGEQRNLAGAEVERCRRMRQRVAAWVKFEEEFLRGRTD